MSEQPPGPWSHPPPKPPAQPPSRFARAPLSRNRTIVLIVLMAAVAAGIWGLDQLFPGQMSSKGGADGVMQSATLVAIAAAGLVRLRMRPSEAARNVAVWAVIAAVLALGYSYRDAITGAWDRVRSEFTGGYPAKLSAHEMVVAKDEDGSFYVMGQINGQAVRFLADTGASDIVLSPADAQRLGVDMENLKFTAASETANGTGYGAPYKAASLSVGPVSFKDVPMQINRAPMSASLLGMTFFKRLDSFQIKDGKLYLRWTG